MQKIANILKMIIADSPYRQRLEELQAVVAWPHVVGEAVKRNTVPENIKDGVLFVKVPHAVWRQELFMQKTTLIKKLNRYLGSSVVKDIKFK